MEQRNNLIEQLREHLSQSDMASANTYDSGVRSCVLLRFSVTNDLLFVTMFPSYSILSVIYTPNT